VVDGSAEVLAGLVVLPQALIARAANTTTVNVTVRFVDLRMAVGRYTGRSGSAEPARADHDRQPV